ncbi:uncharacterized protein LOC132841977 [Tachysurus vachellii]|uniref:uncharacterized protein LOC132841977 n=1 Tax=Tachysurus vachellii TaxID=175792 RepID=UPI00296B1425|nr:uncharacterized protein LOC132841977 [Tachysurus vachellii]XP_060720628.1 uncharacterized protein LOC132841977 [Tachysurus vachellii]
MSEEIKIILILMSIIFLSQLCWTQEAEDLQNHYTSKYKRLCYDACDMHGKNYHWCNTYKGWDYCSLKKNTDYKGNECKDDHPCDLHGKKYYWCYTKTGSWGYCGKVEPKKHKHLYKGSYQQECKDNCSYAKSESYYRCYTDDGWDYCSPSPDVTYKNEPCRSDHHCHTHGYDYSWCWTDSDWGYCGIIEDNGICATVTRQKRESGHIDEICFLDHANRKMTKLKQKWAPGAITDGHKYTKEMVQIIAKWNNNYIDEDSKSNVYTTSNLRLNLQGFVTRDKIHYFGLQIEMKMHHDEHKSSIVAEVFLPQTVIPERHVQKAIIESFCNRARVFVTSSNSSSSEDNCVLIPS